MAWSFFSKKEGDSIGIDIGTTAIKVVVISKASGLPSSEQVKFRKRGTLKNYGILRAYGHLRRKPSQLIQKKGVALLESEVVKMLQELLKRLDITSGEVVVSVPSFSAFVDEIILPPMPEEEMADAIMFEARSHVPISIDDVELTWQAVDAGEKGKRVTIVAVPKETLERYQHIFKQLNLTVKALELETFSVIRSLDLRDEEPVMLLDIGAQNTNISVANKGVLRVSQNVETSGGDITKAIAQGMGIAPLRAEELKKEQNFLSNKENALLARLVEPLVDSIVLKMQRVMDAKKETDPVKKVILTGGSASLNGLREYLQGRINLSIDIAQPWVTIEYDKKLDETLKKNSTNFTVAIGLSLY